MLNLPLIELKAVAKVRGIKGYENMSKVELLSALKESELLKERIKKIREKLKELRHKFSKSKINEIRRNLYEIGNEKNLSAPKIKEIEKNVLNQKGIMIMMMLNTKE